MLPQTGEMAVSEMHRQVRVRAEWEPSVAFAGALFEQQDGSIIGSGFMTIFDLLTKTRLQELAGPVIFDRGRRYFLADRVFLQVMRNDYIEARVVGTDVYTVRLELDRDTLEWDCNCPYDGFCKHIVAVGLKVLAEQNHGQPQATAPIPRARVRRMEEWQAFLESLAETNHAQPPSWVLVFELRVLPNSWILQMRKAYVRKDGGLGRRAPLHLYANSLRELEVSSEEKFAVAFLESHHLWQSARPTFAFHHGLDDYAIHCEPGEPCGQLFCLLRRSRLFLMDRGFQPLPVRFSDQKARIEFRFTRRQQNLVGHPYLILSDREEPIGEEHYILTEHPIWILKDTTLIEVEGLDSAAALVPFTRPSHELKLPARKLADFLKSSMRVPDFARALKLPEDVLVEDVAVDPVPRLYLSEMENGLCAKMRFAYEDTEVDPAVSTDTLFLSGEGLSLRRLIRNREKEQMFLDAVAATGVRAQDAGVFVVRESEALDWLFTHLTPLAEMGFEIYGEDALKRFRVRRSSPRIQVRVSTGIDWFDLNLIVDFDGIQVSLAEIKKSLRQKSDFIKLSDGSLVRIPPDWIRRFQHLLHVGETRGKDTLKLSRLHATLIETLADKVDEIHTDPEYEAFLARLKRFSGIREVEVPKGLKGTLRPYQKSGLEWLLFLNDFRFGGCLADDMGLGKTIQTLALLLYEKEHGRATRPSLIVAPTSVVFNWVAETARFAPDLKLMRHTGIDRQRHTRGFEDYDIILTTYGTLRRDIHFLKDFHFYYVILDESQNIKNPASQTARAARLLRADHRLALTGTPVENNTLELWSLMAFLNPGMLGNQKYFARTFATPIERRGDEQTAAFLHRLVYPFILRRTKEQVEKDLPPKTETLIFTEMEPEQEKLYNTWRDYYRAAILEQLDTQGMQKTRMTVLEGLMKLRQIACHPGLIGENGRARSGKYQALLEHLEEILAEGHKVLVFSQFVKMLSILRQHLDKQGIPYEYLDGRTRNREEHVRRFQEDDNIKLFLISLRAGGTGLNLTAADYVIHYDPWWNPAVEMQASDRAHRIGQSKHVFIYKFITRGTVEEKVLQLQERKRKLVDTLITTDKAFFKQLTAEEIQSLFS